MNRLLSSKIATLLLLGPLALASAACGDTACEELGEICPYCDDVDQDYYESCLRLVADEVDDICDAQTPRFQEVCPPPD
ncbi:MAG: hypothetical protein JRI23_21150 [Deltaproteobacteria bacterium]|jgi:hypothetical protein|nr:hypothetical protein [Deltaproteobacteria bacterium]MBW2534442.1 hypothetical protein [Deltaproteobacteria bacterium]